MPILSSPNAYYTFQTTGAKILKRALRLIKAIDAGETLSAQEQSDGIETLNAMLDAWNSEKLTVPSLGRREFTITEGTATYSLGPSGDFDCPQVVKIEDGDAFLKQDLIELPIRVLTQEQWGRIGVKSTTGWPRHLWYEMAAPRGNVNFFPVPQAGFTFVLYTRQLLAQISRPEETFQLLPGYPNAITHNLAIELAPEYGKSAPPEVIAIAARSLASIKRNNMKPMILGCDPALTAGNGTQFARMVVAPQDEGWGDAPWGDGSWPA